MKLRDFINRILEIQLPAWAWWILLFLLLVGLFAR